MLVSPNAKASAHLDLLLWIVCRIREYARIKATFDAIKAGNNDSMLVCFEEFIIKDDSPLSVIHFSVAMCHEYAVGSFLTNEFLREGFECIGKLSCKRVEPACKLKIYHTHSFKIGNVFKCLAGRFRSSIFRLIPKAKINR